MEEISGLPADVTSAQSPDVDGVNWTHAADRDVTSSEGNSSEKVWMVAYVTSGSLSVVFNIVLLVPELNSTRSSSGEFPPAGKGRKSQQINEDGKYDYTCYAE